MTIRPRSDLQDWEKSLPVYLERFQVVAMSMEKLLIGKGVVPAFGARTTVVDFQQVAMFEEKVAEGTFPFCRLSKKASVRETPGKLKSTLTTILNLRLELDCGRSQPGWKNGNYSSNYQKIWY